jgi:hypothetical protein
VCVCVCGLEKRTVPHVTRNKERLRHDNPLISLIAHVVVTIEFLLNLFNVQPCIISAEWCSFKKLVLQCLEYVVNFHALPPVLLPLYLNLALRYRFASSNTFYAFFMFRNHTIYEDLL